MSDVGALHELIRRNAVRARERARRSLPAASSDAMDRFGNSIHQLVRGTYKKMEIWIAFDGRSVRGQDSILEATLKECNTICSVTTVVHLHR